MKTLLTLTLTVLLGGTTAFAQERFEIEKPKSAVPESLPTPADPGCTKCTPPKSSCCRPVICYRRVCVRDACGRRVWRCQKVVRYRRVRTCCQPVCHSPCGCTGACANGGCAIVPSTPATTTPGYESGDGSPDDVPSGTTSGPGGILR